MSDIIVSSDIDEVVQSVYARSGEQKDWLYRQAEVLIEYGLQLAVQGGENETGSKKNFKAYAPGSALPGRSIGEFSGPSSNFMIPKSISMTYRNPLITVMHQDDSQNREAARYSGRSEVVFRAMLEDCLTSFFV